MPTTELSQPTALKHMFSAEFVASVANDIKKLYPGFKSKQFIHFTLEPWPVLELKGRQIRIAQALNEYLPADFSHAAKIVVAIAPKYKGYVGIAFPQFISDYGLLHYNDSVKALEILTQYSSSEFAVRPFILAYPDKMVKQMQLWSKHENEHVRRLSSEGMRPRLPWAAPFKHFQANPQHILPILENLKDDPSDYVRKSVANTLNDISKDHPELVLTIAKQWLKGAEHRARLVQHALRTLLKKGNQQALSLFNQPATPHVVITGFVSSAYTLNIGQSCTIQLSLRNTSKKSSYNVRCSYAVNFVKHNGSSSRKVFSWKQLELGPNEHVEFTRKVNFQHYSTRTIFPGVHSILPIVNGIDGASIDITIL